MKSEYVFQPVEGYWFTSWLIDFLKAFENCLETTLDLGVSRHKVCVSNGKITIDNVELDLDLVQPSEKDRVVLYEKGKIYEITTASANGYYKLKAVGPDLPPTIEINGIHMHRIIDLNPWEDAVLKIHAARVKKGDIVLDTCTGLGYTAIASLRKGASKVLTSEIDPNVLWIAERNPWSKMLKRENVTIYNEDVISIAHELPDNRFDKIIHDPPRFSSSTGDLYGFELYREFFRILKPGGTLYHYTGVPGLKSNYSILKGIKNRLETVGFIVLFFDHRSQGYIAKKPSR
ncbi:MAG: methyltransferase [Thermosphaera sp.]